MIQKDKTYIIHIIECIKLIKSYAESYDLLKTDHKTYDAVLRQLQIMSESTQRLSDKVKEKHQDIQWREIAGFRNILVHDYLGELDSNIIWSIIVNKLPQLESKMQQELELILEESSNA